MIYLDNAATSWPKPPCVAEAMVRFMNEVGANPGRAGHRLAVESGRLVYEAREAVARLFNVADPLRVVFCSNVTEAINTCLYGYLQPGDHVITGSMEHNSVMRPLRTLEKTGVEISVAACSNDGCLNPDDIEKLIKPNTKLVAVNHASNVVGTLVPLRDIGAICRYHGLLLLVDTAQSAGTYPLDMQVDLIDLLCFTGHKSLYGPTGTGGVIMGDRVDIDLIRPFKQGGTGSNSEHEEQPSFLPDIFESGTPNVAGLSGLAAGVAWLIDKGVMEIRLHEMQLVRRLIEGLKTIKGVTIYGTKDATRQTGVVSFNIGNMSVSEAGFRLDQEFDIMCRVGLHCAPLAHRTIGTFPDGTIRFGISALNTLNEIDEAVGAVSRLAKEVQ